MKKLTGLILIASAITIPPASSNAFGSIGQSAWITSTVCLALGIILCKLKTRKKRTKSKALYHTLSDLADAVESGDASFDPTIKAVFKDIYISLNDLSDLIADGDTDAAEETITEIQYDLERTIHPKGATEKQAEALNKRHTPKAQKN
jgi:hypothetical protein